MTILKEYDKVIKQVLLTEGGEFMAINVSNRKPNCKARDRSHALNTHNRKQKLNLQVIRLADGTRVRVSAKEKRTLFKDFNITA